jgi:hypothetical protein
MNEHELADRLRRLAPTSADPDWSEVVRLAGIEERRRNGARSRPRLALLVAAALAVGVAVLATPLGATIGRTFSGFQAWVSGEPGAPVSHAEQHAFEEATKRSWVAFPAGTQLRRLIETRVSGSSFTLFGFRSGDALCLRLVATGPFAGTATSCAPLQALQSSKEPALVVEADAPFGTDGKPNRAGYAAELASATFGIASDGVARVLLRADDGRHQAVVGGNAFLYVADHPKLGVRVRSAEAVAADGATTALPLAPAPFGVLGSLSAAPPGRLHGPVGIARTVSGGRIAWVEQREPRGEPLPAALRSRFGHFVEDVSFARMVQPDPRSPAKVAVIVGLEGDASHHGSGARPRTLCEFLVTAETTGGGCSPVDELFRKEAFTTGVDTAAGGDQYAYVSGIASDDVARLEIFLGNGQVRDVPLRDNAYAVPIARSAFPARIVGYDARGEIIGNTLAPSDGMTTDFALAARRSMKIRLRLSGPHGATAVLLVGQPAGGHLCHQFQSADGTAEGGCTRWPYAGPPLALGRLSVGGDIFLTGEVPADVARLVIRFADGEADTIEPIEGVVAYAVPAGHPKGGSETISLTTYDRAGKVLARRGMLIRA